MRQSQLLIPTLKEMPADADVVSHQLMLRAGLIRQVASGLYTWLPLGLAVLRKIERIIREELTRSGAQEVLMPVVQPAELWEETGRWKKMGPELLRMRDRHEREFCLGPTHEEVITDLFRREIQSYRQLPCNFFQIQTKFRDEIRPRFGVMRAREFTMKDGYSFDTDQASFDLTYREMYDCYSRILTRMELDFRAVEADTGNIGGSNSHEFHVLAESGEDTIAYATEGDYAANLEKAVAAPPAPRPAAGQALAEVATPRATTIAQVADQLNVPASRCIKTLVVEGDTGPVALVLRGDHDLNEIKAEKLDGVASPLTFASETAILGALNCKPGSIGPVNLPIRTIVDPEAAAIADFVCGANRDGYHFTGANWNRDADATDVRDMRNVCPGDKAPDGQGELLFLRGIEVGHIFQLGTVYSEPMQANVLDRDGNTLTPIMGCYGMGVTRLVAAIIEQNHDQHGITWPEPLAPFAVHIVALNYAKSEAVRSAAHELLARCLDEDVEALLDDRDERPGVKFADADLIGAPHRIVVGERSLKEGNVEYRTRVSRDPQPVPLSEVLARLT
ncbi:MAG: proline--tRNA ligase [Pseudomonadales bacterium]|mgnify:CR=1 FL=1|jgi:prolyl-tRNA synthetase|nr:proline--tRNA ligase [Pseudomonadales bacterium]MDP6470983.1 proline--tRNA ligase [Pseudomonadales bacterium]MDP6825832.1 proline--tRNA ligase [Pseudomonadales bacterium]MDP6970175.1 proline--tRNA ligase [Pseudomonadales bacterium]